MNLLVRYRCGLCDALTYQLSGQTPVTLDDGTCIWKPLCQRCHAAVSGLKN